MQLGGQGFQGFQGAQWFTLTLLSMLSVLLLPRLLGLLGVQLAQPVGDICALVMTVPMALRVLNDLKREEERLAPEGVPAQGHATV